MQTVWRIAWARCQQQGEATCRAVAFAPGMLDGRRRSFSRRVRVAVRGDGRFRSECVFLEKCWSKRQRVRAAPGDAQPPPFRTLRVKCLVDGLRFSRLPGCHAPKGVGSHVGARTRWQNDQHFSEITLLGRKWPPGSVAMTAGPVAPAARGRPAASPTPPRVPKQPGPERPCASGPRKSPYWLAALPSETCSTVPSFPARPEPGGVKPPSPSGGRPARCYACSIAASTAALIASLVTEAPAMESTSVEFASTILAGSCSTAMLPI